MLILGSLDGDQPRMDLPEPSRASSESLPPTELNTAAQGYGLEVLRDKLTLHYKADARHNSDVGAIQSNRPAPLNRLLFYFEITVLERGDHGRIAIGFSDRNFKLTKQPGWETGSYGYHGDDGKRFGGNSIKGEDYGPIFGKGDVVGACYYIGRQEIFFTKNGCRLRTAFKGVKGELFPTVGLHSKGERVTVNFGQQPYKYDIEALIREELASQAGAIDRVPVGAHLVHQVVRQYLLHYGYGDTLRAFDLETGSCEEVPTGSCEEAGQQDAAMAEAQDMAQPRDGSCNMAVDEEPTPGSSSADATSDAAAAAATTSGGGGGSGCGEDWALSVRQAVRRSIMSGDIKGAMDCIREAGYEQVLESEQQSLQAVHFILATQQYIELVRSGEVAAAVAFAQKTLAPMSRAIQAYTPPATSGFLSTVAAGLPEAATTEVPAVTAAAGTSSGAAGCSFSAIPVVSEMLRDIVALVAYERPEESPLAWLLGPAQREEVADAANAAVAKAAGCSSNSSGLERLLRQLVTVQDALLQANAGQGEAFRLADLIEGARQGRQESAMQL